MPMFHDRPDDDPENTPLESDAGGGDEAGDLPVMPAQVPTSVPVQPRLTVVETVHYQSGETADGSGGSAHGFDRELKTGEQLYVRDTHVSGGDHLVPLDTGWLKENVSHVVVRNLEKKGAGSAADLQVWFGNGRPSESVLAVVVPPGETARFTPFRSTRVWLSGGLDGGDRIKYRITAFPG